MDKYKHRVSFRLEKRKDKNGNLHEELPSTPTLPLAANVYGIIQDTVLPSQNG
ncbi:hypothetical protein [Muribaculum gordoncarteri]|uniref:hypothetical protein n=1 Tax=Muribaculum gordoncarteri TaxID=2530390 RepID=UPI003F67E236